MGYSFLNVSSAVDALNHALVFWSVGVRCPS
jgi:hypothetical protein